MAHTPIVDADGHVLEPPTGMAERAPAKFRDRIWQIVTRPDGSVQAAYKGKPLYAMAIDRPGEANCQGAEGWWILNPDGTKNTKTEPISSNP